MLNFPRRTPPGSEVAINYVFQFVNHASHTMQSLEGIELEKIPFSIDYYLEREDEQKWNFYTSLLMDFEGRLRMETFNMFRIVNAYEDVLYTKEIVEAVINSSMEDFKKKLQEYAQQHGITDLPQGFDYYSEEVAEDIRLNLIGRAEAGGTLTDLVTDVMMLPMLNIPADGDDFIFRNTFHIVDLLLHHPAFDRKNNKQHINHGKYVTHPAHMLAIKNKCLFNLGKEDVILSGADATLLSLYVELAMQCVVGQIWEKLRPLMREKGFTEKDEDRFMTEGRAFYNLVKSFYTAGSVDNYAEIPLWDEVLG